MALMHFATEDEAAQAFSERFSDGLPIVLPTEGRVAAMLEQVSRSPDAPVATIMPRGASATVRDVAINAVMAGLPPAAFALALAVVEAAADPQFNLNGLQSTTHPAGPLVIVSGPGAQRAGMNAGGNVMGNGNRTNLTLGRTLRLVMTNIGGGRPGETDMSAQGSPSKLSFCFAERLGVTAWPSLAQRQGAGNKTTVTLFAADSPHLVADHRSNTPERLLEAVAAVMRAPGSINATAPNSMVFVVSPQHARIIAGAGWDVPRVAQFLFERARSPLSALRGNGEFDERLTPELAAQYGETDGELAIPVIAKAENLIVVVAGGDTGGFSTIVPSWRASVPVHRVVAEEGVPA